MIQGERIGLSPLFENSNLMAQAMSKEAIKSDKVKEDGPKTVKMGER